MGWTEGPPGAVTTAVGVERGCGVIRPFGAKAPPCLFKKGLARRNHP